MQREPDWQRLFEHVHRALRRRLAKRYRVADIEDVALPEDNIFAYFGLSIGRQIAGVAASDGYWAMLMPFAPGEHTVHFSGTVGTPVNFTIDTTYYLTVVESNRP